MLLCIRIWLAFTKKIAQKGRERESVWYFQKYISLSKELNCIIGHMIWFMVHFIGRKFSLTTMSGFGHYKEEKKNPHIPYSICSFRNPSTGGRKEGKKKIKMAMHVSEHFGTFPCNVQHYPDAIISFCWMRKNGKKGSKLRAA